MCRRILLWRLSISEPGCRKLVPRMTCTVVVSTVPSIHNTVPRTTCSYYGISVLQHYTWQSTTQYPVPHALCTTVSLYSSTTPCCSCYCFLVVISMTTPALVALCSSLFAFLSSLLQLLLQLLQSSPSKEKTAQQRPRQLVNRVDTSHLRGSCALM